MEDLIGIKFGKLTVASRADNKASRTRWHCICDCGNESIVQSRGLLKNNVKSCGCSRRLSEDTLSSKHHLFLVYKQTCAKNRGHSFTLKFEEFISMTQQNCFYCGAIPNKYKKAGGATKGIFYNGLDRIDNNGGYDAGNVCACCTDCNYAKGALTQGEFITWLKKCHNHLNLNSMI